MYKKAVPEVGTKGRFLLGKTTTTATPTQRFGADF